MRRRPFKEFYEEIFPLSRFVAHHYAGRDDILVTPNLDNRSFDAVIRDCSASPPTEMLAEITLAQDPQQHLRTEYFVKHRSVSVWGPLVSTRTKRNRQIHVEHDGVEHGELVARHCGWIKTAAEGKASEADRYGLSHILLIAFDDYFWLTAKDIATVQRFLNDNVLTLPLNFAALHLVGLSGKTHLAVPLKGIG